MISRISRQRDKSAARGLLDPSLLWQRSHIARIGALGLVLLIGFLVLGPLVALLQRSFQDGGEALRRMLRSADFLPALETTVALAIGSLVIAMILGTWLAWNATRVPSGMAWATAIPLIPLLLPPVAAATGWVFLLSPRTGYVNALLRELPILDALETGPLTPFGVPTIIALTGISLAGFVYLFLFTAMQSLNWEYVQAARVAGSTGHATFLRIVLPMLRPALVYSAGLSLLLGLGQFTYPLLLGTQPGIRVLTTEIYARTQTFPVDHGLAAAYSFPLVIFGLLVVIGQRLALGNPFRFVTLSGKNQRRIEASNAAVVPLLVYGLVTIAMPLLALLLVAFSPFWTGHPDFGNLTTTHFAHFLANPRGTGAIWTSVQMALVTLAVVLPIGLSAALFLRAHPNSRISGALDWLTAVPLGMPAVIFGIALILAYTSGVLGVRVLGTPWILPLAYVTLMIPHSVRYQLSGLSSLGKDFDEASRSSGAGPLRTLLRITLPMLRPSVAAAAAVMFVLISHEFSASVMVASRNISVMGTYLYEHWTFGSYPQVAVLAVAMTVVSGVGVSFALIVGGRGALAKI